MNRNYDATESYLSGITIDFKQLDQHLVPQAKILSFTCIIQHSSGIH